MIKKNLKPGLNRLLEKKLENENFTKADEYKLNNDCKAIWFDEPFAHIKNFSESLKILEVHPNWISYGGARTGSTFVTMVLKILLDSMIDSFLIGWEGDFKEPAKFFELVESTPRTTAGILKIHRSEEFCNNLLKCGKAKAVVSTRDYPSIAGSYARMRNNPYSPFYTPKKLSDEQLITIIRNEITEHQKKQNLPNTLFIREDEIKSSPHESILSISKHLGIDLTDTSARFIGEKLNIESQRELQKNLIVNSTGHGAENFLHFEHVKPGSQRYDLNIHDLIFKNFSELLDEDGYLKY